MVIITTKYLFDENIAIKCNVSGNFIKFYFKNIKGIFIYGFLISAPILFSHKNFFLFHKFVKVSSQFSLMVKQIQCSVFAGFYNAIGCLNVIGLGYKNFVLGNKLFILLGDCNYMILEIPVGLRIFCRKRHVYVLGLDRQSVGVFMSHLKYLKKTNFYKGKGIIEFTNFKFTRLKVGKKQRFM